MVAPATEAPGHEVDDGGVAEHPGLHRGDRQVVEDGVELRAHLRGRHAVHRAHAEGVLGGDRGDDAGAVDAEGGEGREIRRQAGCAPGVRSRDRHRHAGRHSVPSEPSASSSPAVSPAGSSARMTAPMTATPCAPASSAERADWAVIPPRA